MESSQTIQETIRGTHPTTLSFRPKHARLHVITKKSRQVSEQRPNAARDNEETNITALILLFIVGIVDAETLELWNCNIRVKKRMLIVESGIFFIEVKINPNGLVRFPPIEIKPNQPPNRLCNVECVLPDEGEHLIYAININLYQNESHGKKLLHRLTYVVPTRGNDYVVFDYQELERAIMRVERPQPKIKIKGILAKETGRQIIMLFRKWGDNGCYELFDSEQQKLLNGLKEFGNKFGKNYFKDLELYVKLEKSISLFAQSLGDCLKIAEEVIHEIETGEVTSSQLLMALAHCIISAVYRQRGNFTKTKEHLEISSELLEPLMVCEEMVVNQYNWATLYSEKASRLSLTPAEQSDVEFRFENSLHLCNQLREKNTNRYPILTLLRKINFNLRASRQSYPDERKPVSAEGLAKARETIKYLYESFLKTYSISKRHKVKLDMACSDCDIRRTQINELCYVPEMKEQWAKNAYSILKNALVIAKDIKLNSEVKGIEDRLENIKRRFPACKEENYHHSERAIAAFKNPPVENNAISMEDLFCKLKQELEMEQFTEGAAHEESCA